MAHQTFRQAAAASSPQSIGMLSTMLDPARATVAGIDVVTRGVLKPSVFVPEADADAFGSAGARIALIAVGSVDRRTIAAAAFARAMRPDALVAIHVAVDARAVHQVGADWDRSTLGDVRLQVVADDGGGVAATIRSAAKELLADGASEVIVLAGRLAIRGWGRLLLHDHTADAIARAMAGIQGTRVVLVPVAAEDSSSLRPRATP
jgi:hypothetical protein